MLKVNGKHPLTTALTSLRSSHRRCSIKKAVLEIDGFTKFFKIKEKIGVHVGSQYSDCIEKAVGLKNDLKTCKIHYHIKPTV